KSPAQWTPEELAAFAPEFTPEMARLLDPCEGMKTRELPGGTGPEWVGKALAEAEARLASMR
ncbi:MAG: argininosuccinate lyase, partial [Acidobacteria bacterium]|nr:argininosuccinate lyase [Acidobacteriota bacterium]